MVHFSENSIPVFTQNVTVIRVTLNETFELVLEATDADGDELTFDVPNIPPGAVFNFSGNILSFRWHVNSGDEVLIIHSYLLEDPYAMV
jgi:hypothetical protein